MINRKRRLYKLHMAKYKPLVLDAMRNMDSTVQRRLLGNAVALAFHAGYDAGYADGMAGVKDEKITLRKWKI